MLILLTASNWPKFVSYRQGKEAGTLQTIWCFVQST